MIGTIALLMVLARKAPSEPVLKSKTDVGFLSLPRELRDQIYAYTLLASRRITKTEEKCDIVDCPHFDHDSADCPLFDHAYAPYASLSCRPATALLLANKQINNEYMRTFETNAELTVVANATWNLSSFHEWLKPSFPVRILRSIRTCILVSDWTEFVHNTIPDAVYPLRAHRRVIQPEERLEAFVKIVTVQQKSMVSLLWSLRSFRFVFDCGLYPGTKRDGFADDSLVGSVVVPRDYSPLFALHNRLLHGIHTSADVKVLTPLYIPIDRSDQYLGIVPVDWYGGPRYQDISVAMWLLVSSRGAVVWRGTFPEFWGAQEPDIKRSTWTGEGHWKWEGIF